MPARLSSCAGQTEWQPPGAAAGSRRVTQHDLESGSLSDGPLRPGSRRVKVNRVTVGTVAVLELS